MGRRENGDNVDLNRNCIDFDAPLAKNDPCRDIHANLLLCDLGGAALSDAAIGRLLGSTDSTAAGLPQRNRSG
jgi:hypothetical protein